MMTLLEILQGEIGYDSSWAIYAEKIDDKFTPESLARFGQVVFENGGLLDNCELFCHNDNACDKMMDWYGGFDLVENLSSADEKKLTNFWIDEHIGVDASDKASTPSLGEMCKWAIEAQDDNEEVSDWIEAVKDRWNDNCDTEEAALQSIEAINESL